MQAATLEARNAVHQERARLYAMFQQAPVAITILRGPEYVVELANPLALRVWGRSEAAEVLGRPLFAVLPELVGRGYEAIFDGVRTTGKPYVGRELLVPLKQLDSDELEDHYIDFVSELLPSLEGENSFAIFVLGTDVTESVRLRQALSERADAELCASQELLSRIRNASLIGMLDIDLVQKTVQADSVLHKLFGLPPGSHALATYLSCIDAADRERIVTRIEALMRSRGGLLEEVYRVALGDGRTRWIDGRGHVEFDASGRPQRFIGTVADITARREAELERERLHGEVARARARLHATFMQAPVAASVVSGANFVYELANPRYLEMTGRGDIIGKPIRDAFPELPADAPVFAMMTKVYTSGVGFQADEYCVVLDRKGNGQPEDVYFQFTCQPVRDVDGVVREIMTIAVEVTAQVEARRRNDALMSELRLTDQRKDEFLATLAHELRNPMAAISSALALLEGAGSDAVRGTRYREIARRQMGNLVRMVDDLLDVARITRGKVELRRTLVDVAVVLQSALTAVRPLIEERRHSLTVTVTPGSYRLEGDATRLEQVFVNVLQNAAKYTDAGGQIQVRLTSELGAGNVGSAVLRVRDNGRGMPAEMLDKIFDPFTQISPTIDRAAGGIGLGLTLVKRLLELHGGTVTAHSEGPGLGSEFVVRLPLQVQSTAAAPPSSGPASLSPAKRRLRVVVVEDAEDARELMTELLELSGHQVFIACDGAAAVKLLLELQPDIALVDVGLPILDGYEVARRVRAEPAGAQLYLVALTGYGGDPVKARALAAGFNMHLTKPVDLKTLTAALESAPRV